MMYTFPAIHAWQLVAFIDFLTQIIKQNNKDVVHFRSFNCAYIGLVQPRQIYNGIFENEASFFKWAAKKNFFYLSHSLFQQSPVCIYRSKRSHDQHILHHSNMVLTCTHRCLQSIKTLNRLLFIEFLLVASGFPACFSQRKCLQILANPRFKIE